MQEDGWMHLKTRGILHDQMKPDKEIYRLVCSLQPRKEIR